MRHIQVLRRNRHPGAVFEFKTHRLPLIRHPGSVRLPVLLLLASDPVRLAVFDECRARLHKAECYVPGYTFLSQLPYPVKIARPAAPVVFAAARDLLDLSAVQVPANAQRPQERRAVQPLVLKRQFQQQREARDLNELRGFPEVKFKD